MTGSADSIGPCFEMSSIQWRNIARHFGMEAYLVTEDGMLVLERDWVTCSPVDCKFADATVLHKATVDLIARLNPRIVQKFD